jgi:hypothetical protein
VYDKRSTSDARSFSNGNGGEGGQRSDVASNEDLNPGHWWLMA